MVCLAGVKMPLRFCLGALVLLAVLYAGWSRAGSYPAGGVVKAVFDGDTILLDTGNKVRYLGIDCPETAHDGNPAECRGPEARKLNEQLVLHQKIALEYDREKVDVYGRLLAYVVLPDGRCVNAELLRSGHACIYRSAKGFRRLGEFIELQREAVRKRAGMWGACEVKPADSYTGNRHSYVFHRPNCTFGRDTSRRNLVRFQTRWEGLEQGFQPCRVLQALNGEPSTEFHDESAISAMSSDGGGCRGVSRRPGASCAQGQ